MSRSILGMPTIREPCNPLHQSEEQPVTEPFLLYYATWSGGGKKRIVRMGERRRGKGN